MNIIKFREKYGTRTASLIIDKAVFELEQYYDILDDSESPGSLSKMDMIRRLQETLENLAYDLESALISIKDI